LYIISSFNIAKLNQLLLIPHSVIPWALESWAEYDIRVFAKKDEWETYANTENALCILNHRGDLDWMLGWVFIERAGMLGVGYLVT